MNKKDFLKEIQEDTKLITMSSTEKWIHENKVSIESQLDEYGAVLFSDLPVKSAEDFDLFVSAFKYDTFTYEESLSNAVRINKTDKVFLQQMKRRVRLKYFSTTKWHRLPDILKIYSFFADLLLSMEEKLLYVGLIIFMPSF